MKQKWKRKAALFMAAAMLSGVVNPFSQAADIKAYAAAEEARTNGLQPDMEKNLNYQNYSVYGNMVSSYLVEVEGGYMRVQQVAEKKAPVVEYYDEQFQLKSQQYIKKELDGFAGFYAGSDYYYIAWVQALPIQGWNQNKVFMRVTKYDKNWKVQDYVEITSADARGVGVSYLGESGTLRMTEHQGHLYINTCYEGIDTHQRSLVFDIIEKDMTFVKPEVNPVDAYYGSASHSFNQFLLIDEGLTPKRMVTLNQGDNADTGKRGAALEQCVLYTEYPRAYSSADKKLVNTLEAAGGDYRTEDGNVNNYVGMSLGGLEQSQTSYLIAGNSIEQAEKTFLTAEQRNVFVTATSRTNFTKAGTKVTWLTNYKEGNGIEISTPQLVKMNDNLFLVMWREGDQADHIAGKLSYTFVDGNGNRCSGTLGQTKTAAAEITDCKPIVKDGKAVWYSSGVEGVYFYSIDTQGSFAKHGVNTMEEVPTLKKAEMKEDGIHFEWEPVKHAAGYQIIRRYATGSPVEDWKYEYTIYEVEGGQTSQYVDEKTYFMDCAPYDFFICALDENGVPSYGSNIISQWIYRGLYRSQVSLENDAAGVKVNWNTQPDVEFRIYRSSADGTDEKQIATVKGPAEEDYTLREVQSYIDTTAKSGVPYDYSVSVYSGGHESARFNKHSIIYLPKPVVRAESTVNNGRNTITLSWNKVSGAEEYRVSTKVWNETSKKYENINMGKSFSDDKLSCVIYGASEGKKYKFMVSAESETIQTSSMQYSNRFSSEWAETELTYVRPETPPLAVPSLTSVESISTGVKLAWTPVEGVDGYEIAISGGSQGSRTVTQADAGYVDTNVTEGGTYTYKVRGYFQNGGTKIYSDWSEVQSVLHQKPAQPPAVVLSAPSFTLVENTDRGVKLAWTSVAGADGYEINAYDSIQGSRTVTRTVTECEDARVAEGTTYAYKVRAYAQNGGTKIYSDWSAVRNVTYEKPVTTTPVIVLQTPSITSMKNTSNGVELEWTPIEEADGYEIQVSNSSNVRTRTIELSTVGYVDKTSEGTTYTYKIRAYVKQDGIVTYSDWSAEQSIKFQSPTPLSTPQITSIKNTENGVMLTWDVVEGAQEYWIYCYDGPDSTQYSSFEKTSMSSYTNEKAEEGKAYYYVVFAGMSKDGKYYYSRGSEREGIQYKNPQPATPTLKNLTCLEDGVKVEWEPVEGAYGYYIYFYETGASGEAYAYRKILGGEVDSATVGYISGMDGKTYSYYVTAYNPEAQSKKSNIKSIDIEIPGSSTSDPSALSAPNLKSAECFESEDGSGIELTWTSVEGADGYVIYVYEDGRLTSEETINDGDITSHRFYNLKNNMVYIFGMKAYKDIDSDRKFSRESAGKVITFIRPSDPDPTPGPDPTPKPPVDTFAAPENVEVKCVSKGVKITWEPVEGAEGYFVKYCKATNPQEPQIQRVEGQDAVSFVHENVSEGETYIYSVAAYSNTPTYKIGEYSEEKSIVYQKVQDATTVKRGDANGDGRINSEDALEILKYDVKLKLDKFIEAAADANKDGKVNSEDALEVLKYDVKLVDTL